MIACGPTNAWPPEKPPPAESSSCATTNIPSAPKLVPAAYVPVNLEDPSTYSVSAPELLKDVLTT